MKHYFTFLLSFIIIQTVAAQQTGSIEGTPASINGLNYKLDEETLEATLDNANSWEGDLKLPSLVNYKGKNYTLTRIASFAFGGCETLTKVTIPETVREIYWFTYLQQCKAPFQSCKNLESIVVEETNEWMCSIDGVLFNKDRTQLYNYPAGAKRQTYTIPYGVEWIGESAFNDCKHLTSISIPNTVNKIHAMTFQGCENIEQITMPDNISVIPQNAFALCYKLKEIVLPKNTTTIETRAFLYCDKLEKIEFPSHLEKISTLAFFNCTSLKKADFSESIREIEVGAFSGCPLDTIIIRGKDSSKIYKEIFHSISPSVVYVPSTEVSQYKEICSSLILPLSAYNPTAIRNLSESPDNGISPRSKVKGQCSKFYDLSGRRLSAPPARGLYIEDGKVKASHR